VRGRIRDERRISNFSAREHLLAAGRDPSEFSDGDLRAYYEEHLKARDEETIVRYDEWCSRSSRCRNSAPQVQDAERDYYEAELQALVPGGTWNWYLTWNYLGWDLILEGGVHVIQEAGKAARGSSGNPPGSVVDPRVLRLVEERNAADERNGPNRFVGTAQ
jgi:hypothetical protein